MSTLQLTDRPEEFRQICFSSQSQITMALLRKIEATPGQLAAFREFPNREQSNNY